MLGKNPSLKLSRNFEVYKPLLNILVLKSSINDLLPKLYNNVLRVFFVYQKIKFYLSTFQFCKQSQQAVSRSKCLTLGK